MSKHQMLAITYILVAAFLAAVAQYLIQAGALRFEGNWVKYFFSPWILAGMGCHLLVLLLFTLAFRSGGTVPLLYPLYASTYIWAPLLGVAFHHQPVRPLQIAGMALLLVGMACLSRGAAQG